jgi:hypothetical protein
VTINNEEVTQYYHKGVVCRLIGFDFVLPLGVAMLRPGEGEVTAAKRLLESMLSLYDRFFDAVVGDSIYLSAPFIDLCRDRGKHVVAVLKENNPALLADAQAIFKDQAPQKTTEEEGRSVGYWDVEGLRSGEAAVHHPLRVVHIKERETRNHRINREWVESTTDHSWYWATTIPRELMPARQIAQVGRGRWGIENECFNQLSAHWSLDHCFHHQPVAIINFILTCLIAFVLMESFYRLNLKPPMRERFSLKALACELLLTLRDMVGRQAPWLGRPPGAT